MVEWKCLLDLSSFVSKITAVQILQIDLKMYHTLYMFTLHLIFTHFKL
jgi:hypothetical protein